ncbi:MAG: ornithine decarboxylase [Solirubrobacteraceae bacterium]|nr:ornithine decarboxylase [Solirubrobacteraceae bacterium]
MTDFTPMRRCSWESGAEPVQIAAQTLDQVIAEFGTPTYVIDLGEVRRRTEAFRAAFPEARIHYSTKTNPDPAVIDTVAGLGLAFDAATIGEIRMLTGRGVAGADILFTHPLKSEAEIRAALGLGVRQFVLDSEPELRKLVRLAPDADLHLRLAVQQHASAYDYRQRFGVAEDEARAILDAAALDGLPIHGLTFHVGSQTESLRAWDEAMALSCRLIDDFADAIPTLRAVNIGSGFPVDYDGRGVVHLGEVARIVRRHLTALRVPVRLAAEPGRPLTATAGALLTTVQAVTTRRGTRWVSVDASVYQGLIEILESGGRLRYRVTTADGRVGPPCSVGGKTLDPDDVLSQSALLPEDLQPGDRLVVHDVGAYTLTFVSEYHALPRPRIAYVDSSDDQRVTVGSTGVTGAGVLARRPFAPGELVLSVTGYRVAARGRYTFEIGPGEHVEPTMFGRYLNHCCVPNAGVRTRADGLLEIVAMVPIAAGEQITVDYAMFESEVGEAGRGACLCAADGCRGQIEGYLSQSSRIQAAYRDFAAAHLTLADPALA